MIRDYQTPTRIASFQYCNRLGYINVMFPFSGGKKTEKTVVGLLHHDVFAKFAELTKLDWKNSDGLTEHELDTKKDRISIVTNFVRNISRVNYPEFMDSIDNELSSLRLKLSILDKNRVQKVLGLLHQGMKMSHAVDLVLPWKIEEWFNSLKYGIRGRADAIYKTVNDQLIVEDIKSHNSRLDAFMHLDEIKTQMATYAVLAEEAYGKPVNKSRIFYSQDLSTQTFEITEKDKLNVIKIKQKADKAHLSGLPPKLEGEEAIKCQFCYRRSFCFGLDERTDDEIRDEIPAPAEEELKKAWR